MTLQLTKGAGIELAKTASDAQAEQLKLRKACRMFEAEYLKMIWREMRRSVPKDGLMHGGLGEEIFTELHDQAVSDRFVQGGSIGLADLLEQQLTRKQSKSPGMGIGKYLEKAGAHQGLAMPVDGLLSSAYGFRDHPITGEYKLHEGVDLAAEEGSDVRAAKSGIVTFAGELGGYGNLVEVAHADGTTARYGHLLEIRVQQGQKVNTGEVMASVGSTGLSTGPHLHFELRNANGEALDPLPRLAGARTGGTHGG